MKVIALALEKPPLTARDYYQELKAANTFNRYKDNMYALEMMMFRLLWLSLEAQT